MGIRIQQPGLSRFYILSDYNHTFGQAGLWWRRLACYFYETGLIDQSEVCSLFDMGASTLNRWMRIFGILTPRQQQKLTQTQLKKKHCSVCKQWLFKDKFWSSGKQGFLRVTSVCSDCMKRRYAKNRIEAVLQLGNKCQDCGAENLPICCYDFHHSDPSKKEFEVSGKILKYRDLSKIKKELDKCILLCSNCHRIRHRNTMRAKE